MNMENEDQEKCSVCLEQFCKPKYLNCGHTFCFKCINRSKHIANKNIKCPLCRAETDLPNNDVDWLLTNFFVPWNESPAQTHLVRIIFENTDEPFTLLQTNFLTNLIKMSKKFKHGISTIFVFKELWKKSMRKYENCQVTCLSYGPDNTCLVVVEKSSEFIHLSENGEMLLTEELPHQIVHIQNLENNQVYVVHENISGELNRKNGLYELSSKHGFFSLDKKILNCYHYAEGKVAILCKLNSDIEQKLMSNLPKKVQEDMKKLRKILEPTDELIILAIFLPNKNIIHGPLNGCKNPVGIAVSSKSHLIFVSCLNAIMIIKELQESFNLTNIWQPKIASFKPGNMCCGPNGNIFVVEETCHGIITLDPAGQFIGIILANVGIPHSIAYTSDGYLLIGDKKSGVVSKHVAVGYENIFK